MNRSGTEQKYERYAAFFLFSGEEVDGEERDGREKPDDERRDYEFLDDLGVHDSVLCVEEPQRTASSQTLT